MPTYLLVITNSSGFLDNKPSLTGSFDLGQAFLTLRDGDATEIRKELLRKFFVVGGSDRRRAFQLPLLQKATGDENMDSNE